MIEFIAVIQLLYKCFSRLILVFAATEFYYFINFCYCCNPFALGFTQIRNSFSVFLIHEKYWVESGK